MTIESHLNSSQATIHLLPEHLIDQIKAGEVIERPASLLKEIMENSLDANSTEISLHLINNGMDLISLIDNGDGMVFEDLPYAFCRHATSKITRFEDIYHLHSYGFRGEALASICAISRVTCTSSPNEHSPLGGKIIIEGGETKAHAESPSSPKGTSLFIKDLFFNTPARLKFIKSTTSEKNSLKRIIDSFVISHPEVKFSIKWDEMDRVIFPIEDQESRVKKLFYGKQKKAQLLSFEASYEGHTVRAFFSTNSSRGSAHKKQYLFANNRLFTDRQIHQTILRGMDHIYPFGEVGHYCIYIDAPENLIDVNVHPSKTLIKFFKLPVITALISSEMKKLKGHEPQESLPLAKENNNFYENTQPGQERSNYPATSPLNIPQEEIKRTTGLDHDLKIILKDGQFYLFSRKIFINQVFQKIKELKLNPDKDFIPLLISEPISSKGSSTLSLKEMEDCGLLIERLDDNHLVLRAVFQNFRNFPQLSGLVEFALTRREESLSGLNLTFAQLEQISEGLNLDSEKYLKEINQGLYEKIFS